jgi:hypothetical protein
MNYKKIFFIPSFISMFATHSLQAKEVSITYTGPELNQAVNFPANISGYARIGQTNYPIDLYNPKSDEISLPDYTYDETERTIGPVNLVLKVEGAQGEPPSISCESKRSSHKIPVNLGTGGEQILLKKLIIHLYSKYQKPEKLKGDFWCEVEPMYEYNNQLL